MKEFIKPNWEKSNLNISATLADFLGAPNKNAILPILKEELKKNYKNIVFICLDGCGIYPININLKENDFLRRNIKDVLTSTFPSTTTNATTSLTCNLLPREHGWLAWSLHFDEINRNIDLYPHVDSLTGDKVDFKYPIYDNSNCYFDNTNSDYEVTPIAPIYVATKSEGKKTAITNEFELCDAIRSVCKKDGKQFMYCYLPEPDSTMHEFGVTSNEAREKFASINSEIEKLCGELKDTLVVITADHGQVDIEGYVEFYKDTELNNMLEYPPFLDGRTPAFKVKDGFKEIFEKKFNEKYSEDFMLFKTSKLVEENYFGNRGNYEYLLGDYIAVGTFTHKQFLGIESNKRFKGHHTSLTEEMEVPLIIVGKKK